MQRRIQARTSASTFVCTASEADASPTRPLLPHMEQVHKIQKARLSQAVDVAIAAATLLFAVVWVHGIVSSKNILFASSFSSDGFCNSRIADTQTGCVWFDCFGAACFVLLAFWLPLPLCFSTASYLVGHAYGHYIVATGMHPPGSEINESAADTLLLALLLCIGPIGMAIIFVNAGYQKSFAIGLSLLTGIATMLTFILALRKRVYVLPYLNVSITLTMTVSKLVCVGASSARDVSERVDMEGFFSKLLMHSAIVALMWAEAAGCDTFFSAIGGHIWFDVVLFLDALVCTVSHSVYAKRMADARRRMNVSAVAMQFIAKLRKLRRSAGQQHGKSSLITRACSVRDSAMPQLLPFMT